MERVKEYGICSPAFHVYLSMVVFACMNKATFIFLQAMGKAVASTMLSRVREIVLGVGFVLPEHLI